VPFCKIKPVCAYTCQSAYNYFAKFPQTLPDFKVFCSDFHQIQSFGGAVAPRLLHQGFGPFAFIYGRFGLYWQIIQECCEKTLGSASTNWLLWRGSRFIKETPSRSKTRFVDRLVYCYGGEGPQGHRIKQGYLGRSFCFLVCYACSVFNPLSLDNSIKFFLNCCAFLSLLPITLLKYNISETLSNRFALLFALRNNFTTSYNPCLP